MSVTEEAIRLLLTWGLLLAGLVGILGWLVARIATLAPFRLLARIRYAVFMVLALTCLWPIAYYGLPSMLLALFILENPSQFASVTVASMTVATLAFGSMRTLLRNGEQRFGVLGYRQFAPRTWWWIRGPMLYGIGLIVPIAAGYATYLDHVISDPTCGQWIILGIVAGLLIIHAVWFVLAVIERFFIPGDLVEPGMFPFAGSRRRANLRWDLLDGFWEVIAWPVRGGNNGYTHLIDGRSRLLPGHAQLMLFWLVLVVLYLIRYSNVAYGGHVAQASNIFPVLFHVLVLLLLLGSTLTGLAYFLDYYGVPTVAAIVVGIVMVNWVCDSDHYCDLREVENQSATKEFDNIFEKWNFPRGKDGKRTLIIVTAPGGGIQASAWAAKVLTELGKNYCGFHDSMAMICSVSGGSVANMYYTLYAPERANRDESLAVLSAEEAAAIYRDSTASSLEPAAWGLAFPDFLRLTFPPMVPKMVDRGWAMENLWQARLDDELKPAPGSKKTPRGNGGDTSLRQIADRVAAGKAPLPVFHATIVESGQRVLLNPVIGLAGEGYNQELPWDFFRLYPQSDPLVTTAVRLSATFSYVSPICRPFVQGKELEPRYQFHIADGGYADNEGIVTALAAAEELASLYVRRDFNEETQQEKVIADKFDRIIMLRIMPFPSYKIDGAPTRRGWLFTTLGPILTMFNVRVASQAERGSNELARMWEANRNNRWLGVEFYTIELPFRQSADQGNYQPPLSWKLTENDLRQIESAWKYLRQPENWQQTMGQGGSKAPAYLDEIFYHVGEQPKPTTVPKYRPTDPTVMPSVSNRPSKSKVSR